MDKEFFKGLKPTPIELHDLAYIGDILEDAGKHVSRYISHLPQAFNYYESISGFINGKHFRVLLTDYQGRKKVQITALTEDVESVLILIEQECVSRELKLRL